MKIAYVINHYPHVSYSFIRREIAALEARGDAIERFSIGSSESVLVDPADKEEANRTQVLLDAGKWMLIRATLLAAVTRPLRWFQTLRLALRMGWRSERGLLRHIAYLAEACLLLSRVRREGVQHLHAHFGTNATAVVLLTHTLGGPPYSFTVHGPDEFDRPESLSLGTKIEHAAFVVADSDFGRSQLYRWCNYEQWGKIRVVRCGVDASFLQYGPQPVPDTPRLLCVGRLTEQKGQLLLLYAVAELLRQGENCQLVLAGDGPMRGVIRTHREELGLGERLKITGWLTSEAVRNELLSARVMVLPSFAEGLPVVLMEALALGRPVVTTALGGTPELVENEVSGWLIPPGSIDAMVDALRRALHTPTARLEELGRAGAARVAERHDATREAAKLAELFATGGA